MSAFDPKRTLALLKKAPHFITVAKEEGVGPLVEVALVATTRV